MSRPYIRARPWTWKDRSGNETPGIGLMHGGSVKAHLTHAEARTLADLLHDLVDAAGNPEPELPATEAEQEQLMSKQKHDIGVQKRAKSEAERNRRWEGLAAKSHWGVPRGKNSTKQKEAI